MDGKAGRQRDLCLVASRHIALGCDTLCMSQIGTDLAEPLLGFLPLVAEHDPDCYPVHFLTEPAHLQLHF